MILFYPRLFYSSIDPSPHGNLSGVVWELLITLCNFKHNHRGTTPCRILRRLSEDYRLKPLYLYHVFNDKSSSLRSPLTFSNALLLFDERVLCSFFTNVLTT